MLKRFLLFTVIALLSFGLFAYGRGGYGMFDGHRGNRGAYCEGIDLTEAQEKEIESIRAKYDKKIYKIQDRTERRALKDKMHEEFEKVLTDDQRSVLKSGKFFGPGKGKKGFGLGRHFNRLDLTDEQVKEIEKIQTESSEKIMNVLTEEQKAEFLRSYLW